MGAGHQAIEPPVRQSAAPMTAEGMRAAPRPVHPVTPDGRYFVVRGRLWRMSNPALPAAEREVLVKQLMDARRAVSVARKHDDAAGEALAHAAVDAAKRALGERGPVWWSDRDPDLNRHMARNSPYKDWFAALEPEGETPKRASLRVTRRPGGERS